METEELENPSPNISRNFTVIVIACLIVGYSAKLAFEFTDQFLTVRGEISIVSATLPGTSKHDVEWQMGKANRPGGNEDKLPVGCTADVYDSFMVSPLGHPTRFEVIYDKDQRVVRDFYTELPPTWINSKH